MLLPAYPDASGGAGGGLQLLADSRVPGAYTNDALYGQFVDAFSRGSSGYEDGSQTMLLASNGITQPGQPVAMSDAGGSGAGQRDLGTFQGVTVTPGGIRLDPLLVGDSPLVNGMNPEYHALPSTNGLSGVFVEGGIGTTGSAFQGYLGIAPLPGERVFGDAIGGAGQQWGSIGRDLVESGVFGEYSAQRAAADGAPGLLIAAADPTRRARDEMLLEGGGGGPGVGGPTGGGRSIFGEASGGGRVSRIEAAESEGLAIGEGRVLNRATADGTIRNNNSVGNSFDDYVAGTKLKGLDDRGLLGRQERLPTPDIDGRNYVKPDYSIYRQDGKIAAYADAKAGAEIPFDAQARGLVQWSKTTESRTLIYYTPDGKAQINQSLLNYARTNGVVVKQVGVK
ncbi:hypothetical protein [Cupriavidus sp. 8B]